MWETVARRSSPTWASSTPVTVTVCGVFQLPAAPPAKPVKVSDAGLTVTASARPVPSGPRATGVTVTAPAGSVSSTTVQVPVDSSSGVAASSASATVTGPPWTPAAAGSVSTVIPRTSVFVTVTGSRRSAAATSCSSW